MNTKMLWNFRGTLTKAVTKDVLFWELSQAVVRKAKCIPWTGRFAAASFGCPSAYATDAKRPQSRVKV